MLGWYFVLLLTLIMLSAFFSGSEIAFVSVSKIRLEEKSKAGNSYAKAALYIYEHFEEALSAILIGNNIVNIGAASVATVIAITLLGESGVVVSSIVLTVVILIFGEITPKIIAKKTSDRFALTVSYPLRFLMFVFKPPILIIVWTVKWFSKLWRKSGHKEPSVTEEELVSIIESVADDGIIDIDRSKLLQSALEFSDIAAEEILTPRRDMIVININDDMDAIINIALNSPYSRIPVYEGSIDNIIGILHLGNFFKVLADNEHVDIRTLLIEPYFIHQKMKLPTIFSELKYHRLHMAIVTDEYGGTMGCITMEDVLEELVGEIWDETDEIISNFVPINENTYEVNGDLALHDFMEHFGIDGDDFESNYTTVGGWTMEILDRCPDVNDKFKYGNLTVTVTELDGLRVAKITVSIEPTAKEA